MDLTKRLLTVLHAVKIAPDGLRTSAYPAVTPELAKAGLIEERPKPNRTKRDETAYFLTARGRMALMVAGSGEVRTQDRD